MAAHSSILGLENSSYSSWGRKELDMTEQLTLSLPSQVHMGSYTLIHTFEVCPAPKGWFKMPFSNRKHCKILGEMANSGVGAGKV